MAEGRGSVPRLGAKLNFSNNFRAWVAAHVWNRQIKMKNIFNFENVVLFVVFAIFTVGLGTVAYGANQRAVNRENALALHAQIEKTDSAKHVMKLAEEECYWQAAALYKHLLEEDGAFERISESTKALKADGVYPTLEYYKAAIEEMSDGIEDYADKFDDCDYRISLKAAVDAERAYQVECKKLDKVTMNR